MPNLVEVDITRLYGFIVGECSLIQNVQEALNAGYTVELLTGPKIRDVKTRGIMADLLKTYGSKLKLYSVLERPKKHSCLINGNIMYEDYHASDDDYEDYDN